MRTVIQALIAAATLVLVTACGGGGSSSDDDSTSGFSDAEIAAMETSIATAMGSTSAEFKLQDETYSSKPSAIGALVSPVSPVAFLAIPGAITTIAAAATSNDITLNGDETFVSNKHISIAIDHVAGNQIQVTDLYWTGIDGESRNPIDLFGTVDYNPVSKKVTISFSGQLEQDSPAAIAEFEMVWVWLDFDPESHIDGDELLYPDSDDATPFGYISSTRYDYQGDIYEGNCGSYIIP